MVGKISEMNRERGGGGGGGNVKTHTRQRNVANHVWAFLSVTLPF